MHNRTTPRIANVALAIAVICAFALAMQFIYWLPGETIDIQQLKWSDRHFALGADPSRFLLQAEWLRMGFGYKEATPDGAYCTSLSPGYPVTLAMLRSFTGDVDTARILQGSFLLVAGIAIFLSTHTALPRLSLLLALLVAGSPWNAALVTLPMSEGAAVLYSSLLAAALLCSQNKPANRLSAFAVGSLSSMLALTSAGLAPICAATTIGSIINLRNLKLSVAACFAGASLPMAVWQAHCVYATGRPAYLLMHSLSPELGRGWITSWAKTEADTVAGYGCFLWANSTPDFSSIPSYAYRSQKQKADFEKLAVDAAADRSQGLSQSQSILKLQKDLEVAQLQNNSDHPLRSALWLPILRGCHSWIDYRPVDFRRLEQPRLASRFLPRNFLSDAVRLGFPSACKRLIRPALGIYSVVHHYVTLAVLLLCATHALSLKSPLATGILAATLAFTFIHGFRGPEARRNLPAVPVLLILPCLAKLKRQSAECTQRVPRS